jgi:nucleotide-binding universal stress UspA family protein
MAGRIVVATDLTPRSDMALRRAVLLAQQSRARLTLVHAIDPRQAVRAVRAQANRAYVKLLSTLDQVLGAAAATSVDIAVRAGSPLDVVAAVAEESHADLVVLAAPRPRRFDSIVGTTAERLLRAIKRPVLVVHREAEDNYRHVAAAVDLSNGSLPMIQAAARLGVLDHAHTTLLHATSAPHEGMLQTVGVNQHAIEDYRRGWENDAQLRLQSLLAAADIDLKRASIVVRPDPAATSIRRLLELQQPDLLAIGSSRWLLVKRLLIGSITDSVLRVPLSDVLVIPPPRRPSKSVRARSAARSYPRRAAGTTAT